MSMGTNSCMNFATTASLQRSAERRLISGQTCSSSINFGLDLQRKTRRIAKRENFGPWSRDPHLKVVTRHGPSGVSDPCRRRLVKRGWCKQCGHCFRYREMNVSYRLDGCVFPTSCVPTCAPTNTMSALDLNCWILTEDYTSVFSIEIGRTKTVATLQNAIKENQRIIFQHVDPRNVDLWQVSIFNDTSLKQNVEELNLQNKQPLLSSTKLSNVFLEEPKDEHVHIVVRLPSTSGPNR
jgi:hypothetical protein